MGEAAVLLGVGFGVVPQIMLNHELAEVSSGMRGPVIVGLCSRTQSISKG